MKPTPPPILSRGRRILLDLILYIIAFILAVLFLVPDAEAAEVWYKRRPGDKYWHRACTVTTAGVGPVEHYIPDGAVIAVRDKARGILVPITARRVVAHE